MSVLTNELSQSGQPVSCVPVGGSEASFVLPANGRKQRSITRYRPRYIIPMTSHNLTVRACRQLSDLTGSHSNHIIAFPSLPIPKNREERPEVKWEYKRYSAMYQLTKRSRESAKYLSLHIEYLLFTQVIFCFIFDCISVKTVIDDPNAKIDATRSATAKP